MKTVEQFENELQKIEASIIDVYRSNPVLVDSQVERVITESISFYNAKQKGKEISPHKLSELDLILFDIVQAVSETLVENDSQFSIAELLQCLKRLRKSVQKWSKKYGKRGYLDFVSQFV